MHLRSTLLVTAVLAAPLALPAAGANAAACGSGNFCLWQNTSRGGGMYFFSGNDGNLHNDVFARGVKVGDNATSLKNNGDPNDPSGRVDVLAYANTGFKGPALCVPLGTEISSLKVKGLPSDKTRGDSESPKEPDGTWNDDISSFRWVADC